MEKLIERKKNTGLQIQYRDREVLYLVFLHRFMTATHVQRAYDLNWNYDNCQKRLRKLVEHNYLNLPRAQKGRFVEGGGRYPLIYALGNKGADELTKAPYGVSRKRIDWTSKNREVQRPNIDHALMVTDIVTRARALARQRGYRFLDETDIIRELSAQERYIPKRFGTRGWSVPDHHSGADVRLIPDRMFGFEDPHRPEGSNQLFFMLEADRGKESQVSKDITRPTIARKILAYRTTAKMQLLEQHFPAINRFTVLFVATGSKRTNNMYEVNKSLGDGWNRFWFTDEQTLQSHDCLSSVPWREGKTGSHVQLGDYLK